MPQSNVVETGNGVDLFDFPIVSYIPEEPAPFINDAVFVCRNPDEGTYNAGMYRMMRKNEKQTGIFFAQETHAYSILKKCRRALLVGRMVL